MHSANVVELWGMFKGLIYTRSLDFTAIEFHVDSLVVGNILTSDNKGRNFRRSLVVVKMCRLLEIEFEVVVHHSHFKVNQ